MNLYYWIQANKTKCYASLGLLAIAIWFLGKSDAVKSFGLGVLAAVLMYFIGIGFQKMKERKAGDKK